MVPSRVLRAALVAAMTIATIAAVAFWMPAGQSPDGLLAPSRPAATAIDALRQPGELGVSARAFGSDPIANPPSAPNADAGQSKVWQHAGRWWALLLDASGTAFHIHALDWASQEWIDTALVADDRANAHPDVMLEGDRLYVVSAARAATPVARPQLRRFTYDGTSSWALDPGYPIDLAALGVNSPSIARDSTGRVWVTYVDQGRIMVTSSPDGLDEWAAARVLPAAGTTTVDEDVARIAAYGPGRLGLMWSNQLDGTFRFASHRDSDPPDTWTSEIVQSGPNRADNHIDLATASIGGEQRIVAVVKTSLNEAPTVDRNDPLISVLSQRPGGGWAESTFGRVRDHHTRPLVMVDRRTGSAVVVAVAEEVGRSIIWKRAALDSPAFDLGIGAKLIGDEDDAITDPTSTKQAVDLVEGAVVVAWDEARGRYMHAVLSLTGADVTSP